MLSHGCFVFPHKAPTPFYDVVTYVSSKRVFDVRFTCQITSCLLLSCL